METVVLSSVCRNPWVQLAIWQLKKKMPPLPVLLDCVCVGTTTTTWHQKNYIMRVTQPGRHWKFETEWQVLHHRHAATSWTNHGNNSPQAPYTTLWRRIHDYRFNVLVVDNIAVLKSVVLHQKWDSHTNGHWTVGVFVPPEPVWSVTLAHLAYNLTSARRFVYWHCGMGSLNLCFESSP